jgi:hypothetical protein
VARDVVTADELRDALRCDATTCVCRRGRLAHCPSHSDRRPSLSLDERGGRILFHCHTGCSQREVIGALQARGLWSTPRPSSTPSARHESPLAAARRQVLEDARRQRWSDQGVQLLYMLSDWIRATRRKSVTLRALVASLEGAAEREAAYDILSRAAFAEALAHAVEAELDELLAEGRV